MNISDFLQSIVPFSQQEMIDILAHFKKESVSKNQILVRQGEISKKLYFVEKGMGRSYYLNENGKEITQWFFGEGKFMASVDSFFQQCRSLYNLEILEDATLYSISKNELDELFSKYSKMEKLGRLLTTEMLTSVVNKIISILSNNMCHFESRQHFYCLLYRVSSGLCAMEGFTWATCK